MLELNKIHITKSYRICPYCFIICDNSGLARWHFDNCKKKMLATKASI